MSESLLNKLLVYFTSPLVMFIILVCTFLVVPINLMVPFQLESSLTLVATGAMI